MNEYGNQRGAGRLFSKVLPLCVLAAGMILGCVFGAGNAHAYTLSEWNAAQEALKTEAKKADHYIGPGGDITEQSWTMILPGETIAICPEMSYQDLQVRGTLSYNIWQLEGAEANTDMLVRSSVQKKELAVISKSAIAIEYSLFGEIDHYADDAVTSVSYVSLYKNNTGLPFLLSNSHLDGKSESSGGAAFLKNGGASVEAGVITYSAPTLYFVEPGYQITMNTETENSWGGRSAAEWNDLFWQDGTPTFPKRFEICDNKKTGKNQVFTFPIPKKKGARFVAWSGHLESGMPHPIGDRMDDLYYKDSPGIEQKATEKEVTYTFTDMAAFLCSKRLGLHIDPKDWMNDVVMTAIFRESNSDYTVGFDAQGGRINGYEYYLCEAEENSTRDDIQLNIASMKPVRSGYTFLGWCSDKNNPAKTMVKELSSYMDFRDLKEEDRFHFDLYAVWENKNAEKESTEKKSTEKESTVKKAANPLKIKAKTATVKYSKLKKRKQTLAVSKVIAFRKKGKGSLSYKKVSGNKKITVNTKSGKVTVKKGLKKGTYKVKVKVKAKGNSRYKASSWKKVTLKVIVR